MWRVVLKGFFFRVFFTRFFFSNGFVWSVFSFLKVVEFFFCFGNFLFSFCNFFYRFFFFQKDFFKGVVFLPRGCFFLKAFFFRRFFFFWWGVVFKVQSRVCDHGSSRQQAGQETPIGPHIRRQPSTMKMLQPLPSNKPDTFVFWCWRRPLSIWRQDAGPFYAQITRKSTPKL